MEIVQRVPIYPHLMSPELIFSITTVIFVTTNEPKYISNEPIYILL